MGSRRNPRLMLWIVGCSLLAFAIFNAANYRLVSQAYVERMAVENKVHSQNMAAGVTSFFETVFRVAEEMSLSQEVRSDEPERQKEYLRDRFARLGFFDNLVIQQVADGSQTARVRGIPAARPDRWWFRQILQEKRPFIGASFYSFGFDSTSPTTVAGVFFPILRDDVMVSVLAGFLRLEELQGTVAELYRDNDRFTYILDETGTVVVHPSWLAVREHHNYVTAKMSLVARDPFGRPQFSGHDYLLQEQEIAVPAGLRQAAARAVAGYSGVVEYVDLDGNEMFFAYEPVRMPGYGASWAAITVQDKNIAMAPLKKAATANAALSFLIFAGLAGLLLRQSQEVERGVRSLADTNAALATEVDERLKFEVELTAANEELTAMNEEMLAVTDELQRMNQQLVSEIEVRKAAETKLRLRESQYSAIIRLLAEDNQEIDAQMQNVLDSALQMLGTTDGYVALIEQGKVKVRYACGNGKWMLGRLLSLEDGGMLPEVIASGQLKYVADYKNFPARLLAEEWENISAAITLPLKKAAAVVGVLGVTWRDQTSPLNPDEVDMLQQFAALASLAIQGAGMREALQRELVQQRLLHEKIAHMAYHDSLTGLPNRASLKERLEAAMMAACEGQAGAVFFIDMDDLKSINDNFGHPAGDGMIVDASWKIRRTVSPEAFVARLGGDEFVVVLPTGKSREEIADLAEELTRELGREYSVAGKNIHMSASMGVVTYPRDGTAADELMKKADNAMYAAKTAGRNCWRFFEPAMLQEAQEKLLLTNSLRRAMERGEFQVVYQPQVRMLDGTVVGFEALLRWSSPEHGAVSPARFIPLAEQSNLIVPIGEWVIQQACTFAGEMSGLGYPELRVAVNLSPKQLADSQLIPFVSHCLAAAGIDSSQLELEITETALLSSLEESRLQLEKLHELGVGISLDDFGTGYSSLTYLRLFPVHKLKIDKSFIDILPDSQDVMVRSLIQFARSLNLSVVAEGVETDAQWTYLKGCGCDLVQGYLVSRPLPSAAARNFLRERNG